MSPLSQAARKKLKSLATLKGRQKHGLFLAEGIRVLEESCTFRFHPESVFFAEANLDDRAKALVDSLAHSGCEMLSVNSKDIDQLAESVSPQGIVAVFKIPDLELKTELTENDKFILYLDDIADPGNVGTLIRSALAFGVDLVVLSPASVDPFNGKVIRSSAGAIFGQKLAVGSIDDLMKLCGNNTILLGAQKGEAGIDKALSGVKSGDKLLFAIGSEARGLSKPVLRHARQLVGIVHTDRVDSLNAAVAGSIILKEIYDILCGVKND